MSDPETSLSFLTEAFIRHCASPESFRRGEAYYDDGAVVSLVRRGNLLRADVEGSQPEPYCTRIVFDAGGIVEADCDCPYAWGGWCKHLVATALACIREPASIEMHPTVEALLSGLDREQLLAVLARLCQEDPSLADVVEDHVALLTGAAAAQLDEPPATGTDSAPRRTALDPESFRREVYAALHSLDRMQPSQAYWHVGEVVDAVRRVLDRARAFTRANNGRNALLILDALTQEYVDGHETLDDSSGNVGDFFDELGEAWAEALLTAQLATTEREAWADKLATWAEELEHYGIDEALYSAEVAATQGWDDPVLREAMEGRIKDLESWRRKSAEWPTDLTLTRLEVLQRQGRYAEYLHLAEATGERERYATMLVQVGRVQEAVEYGLRHLTTAADVLTLSQLLRQKGELQSALQVAEQGLKLEGRRGKLAVWLRDLASSMGETQRALDAAVIAFREEPGLAAYLRAQELAGQRWSELRLTLLAELRGIESYYPRGLVEVFLHEGLVDDAIAAVEKTSAHELIEQVADAAVQSHPDWVIRTCRQQAESIMNRGKSQHYHQVANWLERARQGHRAAGREEEWRAYLGQLMTLHSRKSSLMPLLRGLER